MCSILCCVANERYERGSLLMSVIKKVLKYRHKRHVGRIEEQKRQVKSADSV